MRRLLPAAVLAVFLFSSAGYCEANRIMFLFAVNGFYSGAKFNKVVDIAIDEPNNLVFVCDAGNSTIDVFSRQGVPKFRIGKEQMIESPTAIAVDKSGFLYVAEEGTNKVKVFDRANKMVRVIDVRSEAGKDTVVGRMTIARDDRLYMTDAAGQRVLIFDKERKLVLSFGSGGSNRGQFQSIEDVAIDRQNRIYVTDSTGIPVQVFDKVGKFIYQFGNRGPLEQDFVQPTGITIDRFDQVWIADTADHRVRIFDRLGFYLTGFGSYGMGEGSLFYPTHVELDNLGKIYVLERGIRRLQIFDLERPFQAFDRQ